MAKAQADIRSKARAYTDNAIRVLVEIMNDRAAPHEARVLAATHILNRGFGALVDPQKFGPVDKRFYVYSIHDDDGRLCYIGKGSGRRHLASANRLNGKPRIRAEFNSEKAALGFEKRLIQRFNPHHNKVFVSH